MLNMFGYLKNVAFGGCLCLVTYYNYKWLKQTNIIRNVENKLRIESESESKSKSNTSENHHDNQFDNQSNNQNTVPNLNFGWGQILKDYFWTNRNQLYLDIGLITGSFIFSLDYYNRLCDLSNALQLNFPKNPNRMDSILFFRDLLFGVSKCLCMSVLKGGVFGLFWPAHLFLDGYKYSLIKKLNYLRHL